MTDPHKTAMLGALELIIEKMENVRSLLMGAADSVREALELAASAFGQGMSAGSDADVAQSLINLQFVLEEETPKTVNLCMEKARESMTRHA